MFFLKKEQITYVLYSRLKLVFYLLCLLLIFCNIGCSRRYNWKYDTTSHELLQLEERTLPNTEENRKKFDASYRAIDDLISQCKKELRPFKNPMPKDSVEVLDLLGKMDEVFTENNFYFCVNILTLSDGLILSLPKKTTECTYCDFLNPKRKRYFSETKTAYHIDCDLGSILYISIAETLNLPIKFVETKRHNFIRWILPSGSYLNWDVNIGENFTDDEYRNGNITGVPSFDRNEEINLHYLHNYNKNEIKGYYFFVLARNLKTLKNYLLAKEYYEKAIENRTAFAQKHCLAYMIVFSGAFNTTEDFMYANSLEKQGSDYFLMKKEYAETLACSYALIGDFAKAIETIDKFGGDSDLRKEFRAGRSGVDVFRLKNPDYLD